MSDFAAGERLSDKPLKTVDELIKKIASYHPTADLKFVEKAYNFSEKAHDGQIRRIR